VWLEAQAAMLSVLREAKIAEMVPVAESFRVPLKIAEATGSGQQESKQVSPQGDLPRKPKNHGTSASRSQPGAADHTQ
jgi:hypothetical protein